MCDSSELVAIKKVLQDKRFKVCLEMLLYKPKRVSSFDHLNFLLIVLPVIFLPESRTSNHEKVRSLQYSEIKMVFLFEWRKGKIF